MVDLTDLMNRPAGSIEAPKQPPAGTYVARVMKMQNKDEQGQQLVSQAGNPKVNFTCQLEAMLEGDQSLLAGVELPFTLMYYFTLTEKNLYRFTQFLVRDLGLDPNQSMTALLPQTVGQLFAATVALEPGRNDPNNFYAGIKGSAPLPQ